MLDDIAESFLNDSVNDPLGLGRQALLRVEVELDLGDEPPLTGLTLGQRLDRRCQSEVLERRGPQLSDQLAKIAHLLTQMRVRCLSRAS